MPGMILGDVALRHGFTWLLSLPMWGLMSMGSLPLHYAMTCNHQTRGQGLLPDAVLSRRCSGWWCLSKGCEAPILRYLLEY
jgi:hypothetical protein